MTDPLRDHQQDLCLLRDFLSSNSNIRVGEIGLDKTRKDTFEVQKEIFKYQLQLACDLGRSVSIHCVRAHGTLFDIFREFEVNSASLPSGIYLHSWSGSVDITRNILRLKRISNLVYFGFSQKINLDRQDLLCIIPKDKILTESDLLYDDPLRTHSLEQVLLTLDLKTAQVYENFLKFISIMKKE